MAEKFFMEIVLGLIASIMALLAYIWHGHTEQHKDINKVLAELAQTKFTCLSIFAHKDDMREMACDIQENIKAVAQLSGSIDALGKLLGQLQIREN